MISIVNYAIFLTSTYNPTDGAPPPIHSAMYETNSDIKPDITVLTGHPMAMSGDRHLEMAQYYSCYGEQMTPMMSPPGLDQAAMGDINNTMISRCSRAPHTRGRGDGSEFKF